MAAHGTNWFLGWSNAGPAHSGLPWGDGSEIAARAAAQHHPWDDDCRVTPLIGGLEAMTRMAAALQTVLNNTNPAAPTFDQNTHTWLKGHVYIADWRFNCLRDLSTQNNWRMGPWTAGQTAISDETAIGLVRRLMQAGIQVRLLLWMPHWIGTTPRVNMKAHADDHFWAARLVEAENRRLMAAFGATRLRDPQLGVVALDMRTADVIAASHHQKLMVIRAGGMDIAFAGGVDLAYTRRDEIVANPPGGPDLHGDWQSAAAMPPPGWWPRELGVDYTTVDAEGHPSTRQSPDLPAEVYGDRQSWHDQHLVLEGPVVATLEAHFCERWKLAGHCCVRSEKKNTLSGQVIVSTDRAIDANGIKELPDPDAVPGVVAPRHPVQMWRTIPLRKDPGNGPFKRGEFTVMAGLAQACQRATELIWIFDQFFWSIPFARLLYQVLATPTLHAVVVLPPHADTSPEEAHQARYNALGELWPWNADNRSSRVAVYAMWDPPPRQTGVYVHAKVQMFDDDLLVCGSANLNRRSFMCDTELAFAIADANVLDAHQRALWAYLFPGTNFPLPAQPRAAGWGATMFQEIATAAGVPPPPSPRASPRPRLIADPWRDRACTLPNQATRERSGPGPLYDATYDRILDSTSVDRSVERGTATLADITYRLENVFRVRNGGADFTYRKPS